MQMSTSHIRYRACMIAKKTIKLISLYVGRTALHSVVVVVHQGFDTSRVHIQHLQTVSVPIVMLRRARIRMLIRARSFARLNVAT